MMLTALIFLAAAAHAQAAETANTHSAPVALPTPALSLPRTPSNAAPAVPPMLAAPQQPQTGEATVPDEPETVRILAVEGKDHGGQAFAVDEALKGLRQILERLGHDEYTLAYQQSGQAPYGVETSIPINERYSLGVTPEQVDAQGLVDLRLRLLEQSPDGRQLEAIVARGKAAHGRALVFRGLTGPTGGELALLISLGSDDQQQQQQGSEENEDPQQQEQQSGQSPEQSEPQEQAQQEEPEEEEQEQGETAPEPQEESEEPEAESTGMSEDQLAENAEAKPQDMGNIEAILESLEETDRREQQQANNRREAPRLPASGEWW